MDWGAKRAKTSNRSSSPALPSDGELGSSSEEGDELEMSAIAAAASEKVFSIELIREKILRYAIKDRNRKISKKNVKNVRLVQRSWLETTSKLFNNSGEPLISLKLEKRNSQADAVEVKEKGKLLDRFVATFTDKNRLSHSLLPIKLSLSVEYFQEENFESLLKFFTLCANGLIELQITYPKDGGSMPVTFPSFVLPHLQKLSFEFSDQVYARQENHDGPPRFGDNRYGLCLLQAIVNSSTNLREFVLPFTESTAVIVPRGFGFLQLPSKIASLKFKSRLRSEHLRVLLRNKLPNLAHLTVLLHEIPFEWPLMHDVLEHLQNTLKCLQVDGIKDVSGPQRPRTIFRFPRLSVLETLNIDSSKFELYPVHLPPLRNKLNNLKRLFLHYQSESKLVRWTQDRKENVEKLSVSLVNDLIDPENDTYFQSVRSEMMERLNTAFPNIRRLTLTVNVNEMTCLKYVFKDMTRLRALRIDFEGNIEGSSRHLVDSILLGLPLELVISLKDHYGFVDSLRVKRDKLPSLRNLSGLMTLSLWTKGTVAGGGTSLFSEILFKHGIMELPNLLNLYLFGKFKPPHKMQKQWNEVGGFMKYSAS